MADILKESAPREGVEANIASVHYFTAASGALTELPKSATDEQINSIPESLGRLTICVLVLENGFPVIGEAYLSPENFHPVVGRMIAREKAIEKILPLMGYELKTALSEAPVENEKPIGGPLILCHGCEGDCDCVCG